MGYREGKPFSAQVLWLLSCKSLGLSASTAELRRRPQVNIEGVSHLGGHGPWGLLTWRWQGRGSLMFRH